MSDTYVKALRADDIAPGGMKAVEIQGREIVICNCAGSYYAIQRRCGHMNAPLDMGTLDGRFVTCAMHCAQFDVTTGEALAGPVPADLGGESAPPLTAAYLQRIGMLMTHIRMQSIQTYGTKVQAGWVCVDCPLVSGAPLPGR